MIGVDDFAFRRSADYGTLVVDIERGKPVELLCSREQKVSITQIAKKLGVSKNTVRYDLRADAQPQVRRNTQRQNPLNAFKAFLEQRFSHGRRNAKALWRELEAQGYNGSYQPVRRWLRERRQLTSDATAKLRVNPRFLSSLLIKNQAQLGDHEKAAVELMAKQPLLGQLVAFAARFKTALLQQQPDKMATWSTDVEAKEWDALMAACSSAPPAC